MTIVSLKEFIKTGQFGSVKIGMTKDEVIQAFGNPDEDIDYGTGSGGLVYARYEFFYWQDNLKIFGIQNDHLTAWSGKNKKKIHQESICFQNNKICIDIWFLKVGQDITYGEIINILRTEKIAFEEIYDKYKGHLIKFESGVTMDFDDLSGLWLGDDNGNFKKNENIITILENQLLNGIRLFDIS